MRGVGGVMHAGGADPGVCDKDGKTPKDIATERGHHGCVQLLQVRGQSVRRAHGQTGRQAMTAAHAMRACLLLLVVWWGWVGILMGHHPPDGDGGDDDGAAAVVRGRAGACRAAG